MPNADEIGFRPLAAADLPLLRRWLATDFVREWYDDGPPDEAIAREYLPKIRGEDPTRPFLILLGERPIGYIQTYRIADSPDYASAVRVDADAAGVDLFIGEADCIHRGLGAPILRRFLCDIVFAAADVGSCVIGPAAGNAIAIRAYEKAGFRYLKTVRVPGEPEPEYLMRIARADVVATEPAARELTAPRPAIGERAGNRRSSHAAPP